MLSAGAVSAITMYAMHYELRRLVPVLLGVLLVSYIIGLVIKRILDKQVAEKLAAALAEGEVIEKDADEADIKVSKEAREDTVVETGGESTQAQEE